MFIIYDGKHIANKVLNFQMCLVSSHLISARISKTS